MKNSRFKIVIIIFTLIICMVITSASVFAWIMSLRDERRILIYSGELDLNYTLYIGNDIDKDGKLDSLDENYDPNATYSRSQNLSMFYKEASKDTLGSYSDCVSGTYLTFKFIFTNDFSKNKTDGAVSLNLATLNAYVANYEIVKAYIDILSSGPDPDFESIKRESFYREIMAKNASRIMYSIDGRENQIAIRRYSIDEEATNNFTTGYSTLVASSIITEQSGSVESINVANYYNGFGENNRRYLHTISNEEKFFTDVPFKRNELLEIEFKLYCMQTEEVVATYDNAVIYNFNLENAKVAKQVEAWLIAEGYDPSLMQETIEILASDYVLWFKEAELSFLFGKDAEMESDLSFVIDKFYITGKSIANMS